MSNPELAVTKKNEGNKFFKAKQYDEAIALYSEAIALDPQNHLYYSNRSAAYSAKGAFAEAGADGETCMRLDRNFLKGYYRAANAYQKLGDFSKAYKCVSDGLKFHSENEDLKRLEREIRPMAERQEAELRSGMDPIELLKTQGNDHFKKAEFEAAVTKYGEAIAKGNRDPEAHPVLISCYNNRAACHQQLGNHKGVVDDCSVVLEHEPTNAKALLRRGLAFEALERYRFALQDIRAVLAQSPSHPIANQAQHRLGRTVRQLKKARE